MHLTRKVPVVPRQQKSRKGSKTKSSTPRKDKERDLRHAIVEDADKTEDANRDLVHGDGGTLGLGTAEDLSHDD